MDVLMEISFALVAEKPGITTIIVEPWAEEFTMQVGSTYALTVKGYRIDGVEINLNEPYLIITAPSGSVCSLAENGVHISEGRMINPSP
jgi:hypothetical protein